MRQRRVTTQNERGTFADDRCGLLELVFRKSPLDADAQWLRRGLAVELSVLGREEVQNRF